MLHVRRWATVITTGAALAVFVTGAVLAQPGFPQPGFKQPTPGGGTAAGFSSVRIIENADFRRFVNVGRDCIEDKDWKQAVQALQAVLNEKYDHYVKITVTDSSGKDTHRWASVKFEANNLLGSMPTEGLEEYEVTYGKEAKDMLEEAKKKGDIQQVGQVAQRFCHTKAGIEANEIYATVCQHRGQLVAAAVGFEKLLAMHPERAKLRSEE